MWKRSVKAPYDDRLKALLGALRRNWVAVALAVVSIAYAGTVTVLHTDALSPVDEWVYIDYLYKLPDQGIVHEGEIVGDETLSLLACEGTSPFGTIGPPCADQFDDTTEFPNEGLTSAAAYTPVYFAFARVFGDGIHSVTGVDQLTGWRLTSVLLLAGSMVVFTALLRQWKVRDHSTLALGLAFIASPFSFWTYTYVSTDAPSVLLGSLLLYRAVRYSRGESSGWWLVALSTLAVVVKVTNILAVLLVGLYLLFIFVREAPRARWQWAHWRLLQTSRPEFPQRRLLALIGFPVLAIVLAGVAQFVWLRLVGMWAVSDLRADQGISVPLSGGELLAQSTSFLPGAIVYSPISGFVPGFTYLPLTWLCIAGVLGAFFVTRYRDPDSAVVWPVAVAAVLFAPMLAITLTLVTGSYFPLPSRYGAPLIGAFLLLAGLLLRNRVASWLLGAYSTALLAVGVWLSGFLATA